MPTPYARRLRSYNAKNDILVEDPIGIIWDNEILIGIFISERLFTVQSPKSTVSYSEEIL